MTESTMTATVASDDMQPYVICCLASALKSLRAGEDHEAEAYAKRIANLPAKGSEASGDALRGLLRQWPSDLLTRLRNLSAIRFGCSWHLKDAIATSAR